MQDEREEKVDEEVEGHRFIGSPERMIGRTDQESDEDEVEAHRFIGDKPEEFGEKSDA
jgi:hypothetical protein